MAQNNKIFKICYSAVLIALGLVLPQFTHLIGGGGAGSIFLPIHLPVFIAGLCIGASSGVLVAIVLPILSFMLTGMPSAVILPYMIVELCVYGFVCGMLSKKTNRIMMPIVIAQVSGRAVYVLIVAISLVFGVSSFASVGVVLTTIAKGLVGVAVQLAVLPVLVKAFRRLNINANSTISCKIN